jgi:hypothetical protein
MKEEKKDLREVISKYLIFSIVATTLGIGIVILIRNYDNKGDFDISFIGQTLLPLWATWVGTILAFYFGKSNFEAATKSYQEIIKTLTPEEKMASIKVKTVMIPYSELSLLDYEDSLKVTLVTILRKKEFEEYNRFAFVDNNKVLQNMFHRIDFTNYLTDKAVDGEDVKIITFTQFIDPMNIKKHNITLKKTGFVSINSNLLAAKEKMDSIPECKDIFVTETGKDTEPILGLITNNTILDNAKV